MFINPDLRDSITVQSLDKIVKYNRLANHKNLTARDTRWLMSLLVSLPKFDRRLMHLIRHRKLNLSGRPYQIKFPKEFKPDSVEEKQLEQINARWKMTKMYSLLSKIIGFRIAGMGAIEFDWTGKDTTFGHFVNGKKLFHTTELDYDPDDIDKLRFVNTDTKTQRFVREDFNPATTLIVRDNPLEEYEPDFPGGLLRVNMVHIILKYWDFFTWAGSNEKYSDPMRYATYEERFKEKIGDFLEQLAKMGTDSYGVFPKGVEIKVLEALKDGAIKSHIELEKSVNKELSLSIAGQYTAVDSDSNQGYREAKIGYQIAVDVTLDDIDFIENSFGAWYLMHDYILNYGEPKNAYPILDYDKNFLQDREAHTRSVTDYMHAGIPLSPIDVYDKPGFERPPDTPEIIKSNKIL